MKQPQKIYSRATITASKFLLSKPFPDRIQDMTEEDMLDFVSQNLSDDNANKSPAEVLCLINMVADSLVNFMYDVFREEDNKILVRKYHLLLADLRVASSTGLDGSPGDPLAARALEALMSVPTPEGNAGQLVGSTRRVALSNQVVLQLIERDNELCLALENEHTDMPDAYIASITPSGVLVYANSGDACDVLTRGLGVGCPEEDPDAEVEIYLTADGGSARVHIRDVASNKYICRLTLKSGVTYGVPVRGEVEIVTANGEFLSVEKGGASYKPSRSGIVTLRIP